MEVQSGEQIDEDSFAAFFAAVGSGEECEERLSDERRLAAVNSRQEIQQRLAKTPKDLQ